MASIFKHKFLLPLSVTVIGGLIVAYLSNVDFPIIDPFPTKAELPPIAEDLIAFYPLDGDGENMVDGKFPGKMIGTEPSENRFGEANKALHFDGKSHVNLGIDFPNFGGLRKFSVSVWFKTNNHGPIVGRGNRHVEGEFTVGLHANGTPFFHREVSPWFASGIEPFNNGEWHNLIGVYDGQKNLIYVDGRKEGVENLGACHSASKTPLLIGRGLTNGQPNQGLIGSIDDVAFYDKALNDEEILKIYEDRPK